MRTATLVVEAPVNQAPVADKPAGKNEFFKCTASCNWKLVIACSEP